MKKQKNNFNKSFNEYADEYDEARPQYPSELFKDLWQFCGINKNNSILEIGAGNGLATARLAKKGGKVIALEPGGNLMGIAKKRLKHLKNVSFVEDVFEDFTTEEKFDVLAAFTSFHWLKDETKFSKSANLLKDNGKLVLVWFGFMQKESQAFKMVNSIYHKFFPKSYSNVSPKEVNKMVSLKVNERIKEILDTEEFRVSFIRKYLNFYDYDGKRYAKLVNSFSDISRQEEKKRICFLKEIEDVVDKYGEISVPIITSLVIAEKSTDI